MGDILGALLTGAGGGILGGITGILGAGLQLFAQYKLEQLKLETLKIKNEHEIAITNAEWAGRSQVAATEAAGREAVADSEALAASYKMEPTMYSAGQKLGVMQRWVFVLLDFVRGIIRPALTIYLGALTTYVLWLVNETVGVRVLTATQAYELWVMVVGTVMYLTTTCVLWWFGTRNKTPPQSFKVS